MNQAMSNDEIYQEVTINPPYLRANDEAFSFETTHKNYMTTERKAVVLLKLDHEDNDFNLSSDGETVTQFFNEIVTVTTKDLERAPEENIPKYDIESVKYYRGKAAANHAYDTDTNTAIQTDDEAHNNSVIAVVLSFRPDLPGDQVATNRQIILNIDENKFRDRFNTSILNLKSKPVRWIHIAKPIVKMYLAHGLDEATVIPISEGTTTNTFINVANNDGLLAHNEGLEGVFFIDTSKKLSDNFTDTVGSRHVFDLRNLRIRMDHKPDGTDIPADAQNSNGNVVWCRKIERLDYRGGGGVIQRYKLTVRQAARQEASVGSGPMVKNEKPPSCESSDMFAGRNSANCNWSTDTVRANTKSYMIAKAADTDTIVKFDYDQSNMMVDDSDQCQGVFNDGVFSQGTVKKAYDEFNAKQGRYIGFSVTMLIFYFVMLVFYTNLHASDFVKQDGRNPASPPSSLSFMDRTLLKQASPIGIIFIWVLTLVLFSLMFHNPGVETYVVPIVVAVLFAVTSFFAYNRGLHLATTRWLTALTWVALLYLVLGIVFLSVLIAVGVNLYQKHGNLSSFNPLLVRNWDMKLLWTPGELDKGTYVNNDNLDATDKAGLVSNYKPAGDNSVQLTTTWTHKYFATMITQSVREQKTMEYNNADSVKAMYIAVFSLIIVYAVYFAIMMLGYKHSEDVVAGFQLLKSGLATGGRAIRQGFRSSGEGSMGAASSSGNLGAPQSLPPPPGGPRPGFLSRIRRGRGRGGYRTIAPTPP